MEVEYARRGVANAGLTTGIIGTSLGVLNGLGGKKNVADVDCCITRLRCTVHKPELVSEELLKKTGAAGVLKKGTGIQVIYGPQVAVITLERG